MKESFIDTNSILTLYSYNIYANKLLLKVMAGMSDEQLNQNSSPSNMTALNLALHMYGCENGFLMLCLGKPFTGIDIKTIKELDNVWKKLQTQQKEYISALEPADLLTEHSLEFTKNNLRFPIWQLLTQAVIHSIHHRGELSIVLTRLGFPLPTLDIILHFAEQSNQVWEL